MGSTFTTRDAESPLVRLTTLSSEIDTKTRILAGQLRAKGLEAPSFDPKGLADFALSEADADAVKARQEIVALTKELHDLVLGPREGLKALAWDTVSYIPLQAIGEFRIAEAVPRSGSISYEDLSVEVRRLAGVDVDPFDLRRLLRLAMTNNVFAEPEPGRVAHNRTSLLFLEDENLASWVAMYTRDLFLPVGNTVAAMRRWPASQEDNETGVNMAYAHSKPFFAHLQDDKARAKRYDQAMKAHGSREGFHVSHTVEGYPWERLGSGTVVDMGGNQGAVSMAIAEAFPSLSFVVQDLPGMRTPATLGTVPAHLAGRVALTTHDFFDPQPVVADAYLFRHVFHAFSDKAAVKILRALVPALRPGARVIVNDVVLPAPGAVPRADEKGVRILDVLMKTVCNARERELPDWQALFAQADARFRWLGAWKSTGTLWFVEAVWEGGQPAGVMGDV